MKKEIENKYISLYNDCHEEAFNIAKDKFNTKRVRNKITKKLSSILKKFAEDNNFIEKYEIICDETNNNPDVIDNDMLKIDINCKHYNDNNIYMLHLK